MKLFRASLFAAAAALVLSSSASAQSVEADRAGIPRRNLISANPIGLLFEWYNGEYERAMSSTASLAIAASRFDFDNETYTAVDGIARYYPSGRALRGLSVGASLGFVDIQDDYDCPFDEACIQEGGTSATLGIRGDYVWIIGRDQVFTVATGLGAKRVLADDVGTEFIPIGRLSIGYAF
jgi:hypothetical protein